MLVEDDDHLGFLVEDQLSSNDYDVTWVKNGEIAWQKFDNGNFDLCLLDILLPGMDGIELAKKIKNKNRKIPVIFITSRSLKSDIITGFDVGCDDYIVKPFEVYQLLLRIRALLIRVKGYDETEIAHFQIGNLTLDSSQQIIAWPNGSQKINRIENQILSVLMASGQRVVPRNYILETIWGRNDMYTSKSLDTYLYKIRKYLKPTDLTLENIYGSGYVLKTR